MGKLGELGFGNGAISSKNWEAIQGYIRESSPTSVLEVGTGYSTVLFEREGLEVVSLDTSQAWLDAVNDVTGSLVTLVHYVYPEFPKLTVAGEFDFAFVDGPGQNNHNGRRDSMAFVSKLVDTVFVHDSRRERECESIRAVFGGWVHAYIGDGLSLMTRGA